MAIQVADNFQYLGQKPLDARVKYATVADMAAVAASSLYDGIMAYVVATEKNYQWKSTNPVDQTLGKWREFESGSGGASDLDDLGDVEITDVADGEVLKYNATEEKWVNGEDVGGAGRAKSTAIAPVFDDTETYAAGDRVMYEDELYVFNTAHTGAWAAADADKTDVDSEIPDKLTSQQMQDIKDAFVVDSPKNGYPVLFDETGAEHFVGWYKYANGTKKPIYQKTVNLGTLIPVSTETYANIGINNADRLVYSYCSFNFDDGNIFDNTVLVTKDFGYLAPYIEYVGHRIMLAYLLTYNANNVVVTVQYTKTTDTPQ